MKSDRRALTTGGGPRRGKNGRFEALLEQTVPIPTVEEIAAIEAKWARERQQSSDVLMAEYAVRHPHPVTYSDALILAYAQVLPARSLFAAEATR
jgi:hypothetical protein